jgi:hypothetical protein
MARRTILIDDLDGGEAAETIAFAIDGMSYEIDLSDGNAKKLREALSPFIASARPVAAPAKPAKKRGAKPRPSAPRPATPEQAMIDDVALARFRPSAEDTERVALIKLRGWCRATDRPMRGRGGAAQHRPAYLEYYGPGAVAKAS